MLKLKPCPKCGKTQKDGYVHEQKIYIPADDWEGWEVMCENCGRESGDFLNLKDAIEAWNRTVNEK